jgi:hypothetical protein
VAESHPTNEELTIEEARKVIRDGNNRRRANKIHG